MKRRPDLLRLAFLPVPEIKPLVWCSCFDRHSRTQLSVGAVTTRLLGLIEIGNPEALNDISNEGVSLLYSPLSIHG